jgi:hypothetical protein
MPGVPTSQEQVKRSGDDTKSSFDAAQRRAKFLESRLEQRVQAYSTQCAKLVPASFVSQGQDVETGMSVCREEQRLSREVELDLVEMLECIDTMRAKTDDFNHTQQEVCEISAGQTDGRTFSPETIQIYIYVLKATDAFFSVLAA